MLDKVIVDWLKKKVIVDKYEFKLNLKKENDDVFDSFWIVRCEELNKRYNFKGYCIIKF